MFQELRGQDRPEGIMDLCDKRKMERNMYLFYCMLVMCDVCCVCVCVMCVMCDVCVSLYDRLCHHVLLFWV